MKEKKWRKREEEIKDKMKLHFIQFMLYIRREGNGIRVKVFTGQLMKFFPFGDIAMLQL